MLSIISHYFQTLFQFIGSFQWITYISILLLNNAECVDIFYNINFLDRKCFSLVISKFFGYISMLGAGKLIIITNIISEHTAHGLEPYAVYIELSSYVSFVYYNYIHNNDFSTYCDFSTAAVQNVIIIILMWYWGISKSGQQANDKDDKITWNHKLMICIIGIFFCSMLYICPVTYYSLILSYSIGLNLISKVPQIYHNYNTKDLGVQSTTAAFIAFMGSVMKLYVAWRETS